MNLREQTGKEEAHPVPELS